MSIHVRVWRAILPFCADWCESCFPRNYRWWYFPLRRIVGQTCSWDWKYFPRDSLTRWLPTSISSAITWASRCRVVPKLDSSYKTKEEWDALYKESKPKVTAPRTQLPIWKCHRKGPEALVCRPLTSDVEISDACFWLLTVWHLAEIFSIDNNSAASSILHAHLYNLVWCRNQFLEWMDSSRLHQDLFLQPSVLLRTHWKLASRGGYNLNTNFSPLTNNTRKDQARHRRDKGYCTVYPSPSFIYMISVWVC